MKAIKWPSKCLHIRWMSGNQWYSKWQVSLHAWCMSWRAMSEFCFMEVMCASLGCFVFLWDGCRRFIYWFCNIGNLPLGQPPPNMNVAYRKPMVLVRSQLLAHRSDPDNDESAIVGWSLKMCHLAVKWRPWAESSPQIVMFHSWYFPL